MIELAKMSHVQQLEDLYRSCTNYLLEKGIYQWDENYPSKQHITFHVENNEMFILKENETIIGAVVLNELQTPEWETVDWKYEKPLIIHMLCVHPSFQNGGYGRKLLTFSDQYAATEGYKSLRLDSFSKNDKSLAFYKKAGYVQVGEIQFPDKSIGNETYLCLEKRIEGVSACNQ